MSKYLTWQLEVIAVQDELGVAFPREFLERIDAHVGDTLYLEPISTGYMLITRPPD